MREPLLLRSSRSTLLRAFVGLALCLPSACSDDPDGGSGTGADAGDRADGGDDAASLLDGGSADTGMMDASGADAGSALERHCRAASDYLDRCEAEIRSFCARAELAACTELTGVERPEVVAARESCGFPEACTVPPTFEMRLCVYQATESLEPTDLQRQLADNLCGACAPGQAECLDSHFFRTAPRNDGTAVVQGAGISYLLYGDEFVQQLIDRCIPAAETAFCFQSFYDCIAELAEPLEVRMACAPPIGPGG